MSGETGMTGTPGLEVARLRALLRAARDAISASILMGRDAIELVPAEAQQRMDIVQVTARADFIRAACLKIDAELNKGESADDDPPPA